MSDMTVAELAEDREACGELARLFWAGAHVGSQGMQEAVQGLVAFLAPAPDGLHIAPDANDDMTLWDGRDVVARECEVTPTAWRLLTEAVTPDPPNAANVQADADDDRPLRVGDQVVVSEGAMCVGWGLTGEPSPWRGKRAKITSFSTVAEATATLGNRWVVGVKYLTRIDEGSDA